MARNQATAVGIAAMAVIAATAGLAIVEDATAKFHLVQISGR